MVIGVYTGTLLQVMILFDILWEVFSTSEKSYRYNSSDFRWIKICLGSAKNKKIMPALLRETGVWGNTVFLADKKLNRIRKCLME
jgi:hypothetical protein